MAQTNKQRYSLRYTDIKIYKRQGYKVINTHTVYRYKQCPWLRKYIENNTKQRIERKVNSRSIITNYWVDHSIEKQKKI